MPKKDIGFRFSEEAHEILLELSKEWGCTRTHVIERLLRAERTLEPKILPNDPKEVVRVVGVDPARGEDLGATVRGKVEKGVLTVDSVETGDTRTRQEKADDFYRANMAKGKK